MINEYISREAARRMVNQLPEPDDFCSHGVQKEATSTDE